MYLEFIYFNTKTTRLIFLILCAVTTLLIPVVKHTTLEAEAGFRETVNWWSSGLSINGVHLRPRS